MPPKTIYSREEIREKAYSIVKTGGIGALTARSLADSLGTSTRPIFTAFSNMDDVLSAVKEKSVQELDLSVSSSLRQTDSFKELGDVLLRFSRAERNLFNLIFHAERTGKPTYFDDLLSRFSQIRSTSRALILNEHLVSDQDVEFLFRHYLLFVLSVCMLESSGMVSFGEGEAESLFSSEYQALMKQLVIFK